MTRALRKASPSTERVRLHRQRRTRGTVVVPVEICDADILEFEIAGLVTPEQAGRPDRKKLAVAVRAILNDWVKARRATDHRQEERLPELTLKPRNALRQPGQFGRPMRVTVFPARPKR